MKTATFAIALLLLLSGSPVHGQKAGNEISIGVGGATFPDIAETAEDVGSIIGTIGLLRHTSKRTTPAVFASYGRFVDEHLKLGVSAGYQKFKNEYFIADAPWFSTEVSYFNFMFRGDYVYFDREWVDLYSGAGLGMAVVTEEKVEQKDTDTEYWFSFHVNALGARFGKRVAGFAELGFGFNGIVSAGLTAAF